MIHQRNTANQKRELELSDAVGWLLERLSAYLSGEEEELSPQTRAPGTQTAQTILRARSPSIWNNT